jgi:saccharopine dehydrogenase-like NADP-dependent oxidoreductase
MIAGAGKIGSLIALLLAESGRYRVLLVDKNFTISDSHRLNHPALQKVTLDLNDAHALLAMLQAESVIAVVTCLPFFLNHIIASQARAANIHYLDLTEDNDTAEAVATLAQGTSAIFMPRCGLAPGWVGIVAQNMVHDFDSVRSVQLRTGGLPQEANNSLQYALTWSTDGLINEYIKPCHAIRQQQRVILPALEDIETVDIDGLTYEAFNTAGGLGNLVDLLLGQVETLDYKTLRYPGHAKLMQFLLTELRLSHEPATLKRLLEQAIPKTYHDVVVIYITVSGWLHGELTSTSYVRKLYPANIGEQLWSAMQVATASSVCACLDEILTHTERYSGGYLAVETLPLKDLYANAFGQRLRGDDEHAI